MYTMKLILSVKIYGYVIAMTTNVPMDTTKHFEYGKFQITHSILIRASINMLLKPSIILFALLGFVCSCREYSSCRACVSNAKCVYVRLVDGSKGCYAEK